MEPTQTDILTLDIPTPTPGTYDLAVMRDRRGGEVLERDLLASHVVALTEAIQKKDAQIAALRAKVKELEAKEEAPAAKEFGGDVHTFSMSGQEQSAAGVAELIDDLEHQFDRPPSFLRSAEDLVGAKNGQAG